MVSDLKPAVRGVNYFSALMPGSEEVSGCQQPRIESWQSHQQASYPQVVRSPQEVCLEAALVHEYLLRLSSFRRSGYLTRIETGMPELVMQFRTLQPIFWPESIRPAVREWTGSSWPDHQAGPIACPCHAG